MERGLLVNLGLRLVQDVRISTNATGSIIITDKVVSCTRDRLGNFRHGRADIRQNSRWRILKITQLSNGYTGLSMPRLAVVIGQGPVALRGLNRRDSPGFSLRSRIHDRLSFGNI